MTATVSQPTQTAMDVPAKDENGTAPALASQDVGLIFVREYYTFLNRKPQRLYAFYGENSVLVRGDEGESVSTYHGQEVSFTSLYLFKNLLAQLLFSIRKSVRNFKICSSMTARYW